MVAGPTTATAVATVPDDDGTPAGLVPSTNDLIAAGAVFLAYVIRFGSIAEGVDATPWLTLTTDCLIPLLAAVWLLAVPTYQLCTHVRAEI